MNTLKSAEKRSTLAFALPLVLVVAWLLVSGLFLAAISTPAALDSSINTVLAEPQVEPQPSIDATATAAVSAEHERSASNGLDVSSSKQSGHWRKLLESIRYRLSHL